MEASDCGAEWRTIKSAPKDGTEIDVWCPEHDGSGGYRVTRAWWSRVDHKWLQTGQGDQITWQDQPTHWMPEPKPPTV